MRHTDTPPTGRVHTGTWYTEADHRRAGHFYPGNWHSTRCAGCHRVDLIAAQAMTDQHAAWAAEDRATAARGLGMALVLMALTVTGLAGAWLTWLWLTNLGDVYAHHLAGPLLLGLTFYVLHRIHKTGKNR